MKTAALIALCTTYRIQTISKIKIENILNLGNRLKILISDILKTSAAFVKQPKLVIPFFSENPDISVATAVLLYIRKTQRLRGGISELFITNRKPFTAVSAQTLSRWINKTILNRSGSDKKKLLTVRDMRHRQLLSDLE